MGTLRIDTLGANFSINAKEDDRYLAMLLESYKNMVRAIEQTNKESRVASDSLKTAIMAGIMLCDELYKEKQKYARIQQDRREQVSPEIYEVERMTQEMIDRIDAALRQNTVRKLAQGDGYHNLG
ncbi:MAG: cell division protein ZapA [Treponemataceae bacterium]|nr:MAG: cell division protein ZapA [Treponemataceae bacterium]